MVSVPAVVEPPTDLPLPVLLLVLGLRDHEVVDAALVVVAGLVRRVLKVNRKIGLKLNSKQKNLKTKIYPKPVFNQKSKGNDRHINDSMLLELKLENF